MQLSLIAALCISQLQVGPPPPPSTLGNSHIFTAPGVGLSPRFRCLRGRDFELEKFPTVLKEKCRNFSICFKETGAGQLEKQAFLCCFRSIFEKSRMSTVSLIAQTILAILVILIKVSGHPRVISAIARSS